MSNNINQLNAVQSVSGATSLASSATASFVNEHAQIISLAIAFGTFLVFIISFLWSAYQTRKRSKDEVIEKLIFMMRLQGATDEEIQRVKDSGDLL